MKNIRSLPDCASLLVAAALLCVSPSHAQAPVEQILQDRKDEEPITFAPEVVQLIAQEVLIAPTTSQLDLQVSTKQLHDPSVPLIDRVESATMSVNFMAHDFRLDVEGPKTKAWTVQGTAARLKTSDSNRAFRELLQIQAPASLKPYSWMTFRIGDGSPDLVWIYSPFIKRERRIAPALRDEPLFYTPLSASDLFTFSEQREHFTARVSEAQTYLAPIRSLRADLEDPPGSCATLPSSIAPSPWRPRMLERIELLNRDPYSVSGRIVVYADRDTALPLIKIIYDRKGVLQKLVFSDFAAIIRQGDDRRFVPLYLSTTAISVSSKQRATLRLSNALLCAELPQGWSNERFDPYRIGKES